LLGLIPIFLARSWPARITAMLFGAVSLVLGVVYIGIVNGPDDVLAGVNKIRPVVYLAFGVALLSLVVTYCVDRKYAKKR
jgi:hypothetical protein